MLFTSPAKRMTIRGLAVLAAFAGFSTPSSAHIYTRCDYEGAHCVRVHCDWDGDRCWEQSLYRDRTYYRGHGGGHWVCNRWGDCRWVYWHPNPQVGIHLSL